MLPIYTIAIFLAAALLFCVQPMLARMLLPKLGGSPAVWTAAMLFFQAGLLLGYLGAHVLGLLGRRAPRVAIAVHLVLAAAAVLALPLALPAGSAEGPPALWVMFALALAIGAPYLVLSSVSPLLQRWISTTDHKLAADPYPLYAASNAGSLLGLLAYPFIAEPLLSLDQQRSWWSIAYVALVVLLGIGSALVIRRTRAPREIVKEAPAEPVTGLRRLAWVGLAMVPSSLLLGVTQHLTTDVAAAPLLWVVPLSLYLLTFIIAFGVTKPGVDRWVSRLAPIAVVGVVVAMLLHARQPLAAVAGAHIAAFALAAMLCHQRLASLRPEAGRLTEFYLLVALGGVLGGAFNALLAPVIFDRVLEYPIAIALAMLALPGLPKWKDKNAKSLDTPAGQLVVGGTVVAVFVAILVLLGAMGRQPLAASAEWWDRGLAVGLPALALYVVYSWPVSFSLAVGGVLLAATFWKGPAEVIHIERTFFGVHMVEKVQTRWRDGSIATLHQLRHGSTAHGLQRVDTGGVPVPLAYYHDQSPIADIFAFIDGQAAPRQHHALDRVALVGLGSGALAAYGRPGMTIHAYEIDPAVVEIARNPLYFTFVSQSRADEIEYFVGDGRLLMEAHEGEPYDLIVLDAFSSDAIPVHLLTLEAFEVYLDRLADGGVLAVHISNVYLNLEPVVARAAERLGLHSTMRFDLRVPEENTGTGRYTSTWVMLSRLPDDLTPLRQRTLWRPPMAPEGFRAWTDDRSNLLSVIGTPPQE
ncbi:MAG: fused MFS/spermidine synthase [Phycisphaera sp.]|nr:MAG: fused MFS/spermidine synthase [Phycisphaera sp.]